MSILIGIVGVVVVVACILLMCWATEVIPGVSEPGLHRKLNKRSK